MKNYSKFICAILCLFVCYGCPETHYKDIFTFRNRCSKELFVILADRPHSDGSGIYPDTTLNIDKKWGGIVSVGNYMKYGYYIHNNKDTLSLFILDLDTVNRYSWEEIKAGYKVLQRYDLSIDNFHKLPEISFPPTKLMENIKMYPPYGSFKE